MPALVTSTSSLRFTVVLPRKNPQPPSVTRYKSRVVRTPIKIHPALTARLQTPARARKRRRPTSRPTPFVSHNISLDLLHHNLARLGCCIAFNHRPRGSNTHYQTARCIRIDSLHASNVTIKPLSAPLNGSSSNFTVLVAASISGFISPVARLTLRAPQCTNLSHTLRSRATTTTASSSYCPSAVHFPTLTARLDRRASCLDEP